MIDSSNIGTDHFDREELVEKYTNNMRRSPTLDEVLTTFDPDELYLLSNAETRENVYVKEGNQRIWRGGGFGHTPFVESLFDQLKIEMRRSVDTRPGHTGGSE